MLPDMSLLIGQKLMKKAGILKSKMRYFAEFSNKHEYMFILEELYLTYLVTLFDHTYLVNI